MKKTIAGLVNCLIFSQLLSAQAVFPDNGPLYDDTVVPRIDIKINPDTLDWIFDHPESDAEFHAVFVFTNGTVHDTIDPVGFRLRGNTSRESGKKSFKVSFNTFTTGGKYYGVEKLNLNGEHNDPSIMRSKIMWDILKKWNIPAPRANHVRVYINGSYYGLYINVEHIDEEFVESRFGNKDGNLYKCLYPADLDYRGPDPDNYKYFSGDRMVYELKTNPESNDYSDLAALAEVLFTSSDDKLSCDLDSLFNTYDYLKIMAADIFCGNWDGYIFNKNNFYLYHNTATNKFEYIPYDVDNTFGIDWFSVDWARKNIYSWQPGGIEKRPLYDRIINNPELRKQFTWYANQLITTTLDIDSLVASIEERKNMIAPYVGSDPYYPLDYGYDYDKFLLSYNSATGLHVKFGIYPYLYTRSQSIAQQAEPGVMSPVVKYAGHNRDSEQSITISALVEAAALPVDVVLIYSLDDGDIQQTAMSTDGKGKYTVVLDNLTANTTIGYQVIATDNYGQTTIRPCELKMVRPSGRIPLLYINEFMADNSTTISDEYENYSDWLELYNGDNTDVFLGDLYLTDDLNLPYKWRLPAMSLSPGAFLLIWIDGYTYLGDLHTSIRLDNQGEAIGLFSSDQIIIDTLTFGIQKQDISYGRISDGAEKMVFFSTPTPGASNSLGVMAPGKLFVYPNPAKGPVIRLNQSVTCTVYNSSGVRVFAGRDVDEIEIGGYSSGFYIIVTDSGQSAKFVVIKSL